MELSLAENIRTFRKERRLTQEQFAEAMGVTVGSVYKWETGQAIPELGMLVGIADFFDTSMDVLLGYRVKDNRIAAIGERLREYCRVRDREALAEAEKASKNIRIPLKLFTAARRYTLFLVPAAKTTLKPGERWNYMSRQSFSSRRTVILKSASRRSAAKWRAP